MKINIKVRKINIRAGRLILRSGLSSIYSIDNLILDYIIIVQDIIWPGEALKPPEGVPERRFLTVTFLEVLNINISLVNVG